LVVRTFRYWELRLGHWVRQTNRLLAPSILSVVNPADWLLPVGDRSEQPQAAVAGAVILTPPISGYDRTVRKM
jgi:hypothetical protein